MKVDRSTHYYPFGLEFGGDLNIIGTITPSYRYSTQGQEKQIDTKWSSYRWRNYDAGMGRFFNIDPLAEKYVHNSPYAFAENRVIDGRELEGLEWVRSTTLNQDGTKTHTLNADIKLVNDAKNFTSENMKDFQTSYVNNMRNSYNGLLSNGDKLEIGKINFETVNSVNDGDYSITIVDTVLDPLGNAIALSDDTEVKGMIQLEGKNADTVNGYIGNSQQNNMQVVRSGKSMTGEATAHETGHSFGLRHDTDKKNPIKSEVKPWNLMHAPRMGNGMIPEQRDIIIQNVPEEKIK